MNRNKRVKTRSMFGVLLLLGSVPSYADVWCTLSGFVVEAYDHSGVFVHGTLGGFNKTYIALCGLTNGQQDCSGRAADRRYAMALAAQTTGRDISMLFTGSLTDCSAVGTYAQPTTMRLLN
jgi:hypothetical protein